MKIVYDHQIFAMQEHGGVSRYFVELAKQLSTRSDIELDLPAPLHFNRYLEDFNLKTTFGIRVPKFPMAGKLAHLVNNLITQAWLQKHEPDIIHSTYYFPFKRTLSNKAKVVLTVYDMTHELYPQYFSSLDRAASLKYEAVQKADHIICISQTTKDDLVRINAVNPKKVSVVHLGVNRIKQESVSTRLFSNTPYLLFVGARGGHKNFSRLLEAYAGCTDLNTNMKLFCFGGGKFSNKEQTTHKRLGLGKGQIQWVGGSDPVLANLYKYATAFVYPSLYEGFGLPPLEAMSFNCPVVCSNQGSIPEVVGDAGEYFDPQNASEMAEAITRVCKTPSYAEELRNRGNLQIKKFSWQRCAEETYKIYESLL